VIAGLGSLAWMPYFPLWSFTYVLISIFVIYALVAHGGLQIPDQITNAIPDLGGGPSGGDPGSAPPPPPGPPPAPPA
jgi:hypothetical protein